MSNKTQELAQPNLSKLATAFDALLHDGKIILSIDDAIALALENNLDLEIARFPPQGKRSLLRAKSGGGVWASTQSISTLPEAGLAVSEAQWALALAAQRDRRRRHGQGAGGLQPKDKKPDHRLPILCLPAP